MLAIFLLQEKPLITFKRGEVIKLPIKRKKSRVFIEPELASNIMPTEVRSGLSLASVTAELEVKDNVYTIKVIFICRKILISKTNVNLTIKINFAALFFV
jgi:integrator complex subunit 9